MLGDHPSIVIPQNTPYAEEMRKHEALHTKWGRPGKVYQFAEFPKMLYKAERGEKGVSFTPFKVNDQHEQQNMLSRGFAMSQTEALAALEAEQTEHGKLAAERNYEIKHGRVSERAAAEVRAAEAEAGAVHLPEVPAKPVRRRGPNKPKAV